MEDPHLSVSPQPGPPAFLKDDRQGSEGSGAGEGRQGVGGDTQEAALFLEPRFKETQDAKFCPSHCGCGGGSPQPGALLSGGGGASGPEARRLQACPPLTSLSTSPKAACFLRLYNPTIILNAKTALPGP